MIPPLALFMDHDTSEWQSADASFCEYAGRRIISGKAVTLLWECFFHPRMGRNAYQGYNCGYYAAITLVPENTTPPTPPTLRLPHPPPNPPAPPTPPSGGGTSGGGGGGAVAATGCPAGIARHRIPTDLVLPLNRKPVPLSASSRRSYH